MTKFKFTLGLLLLIGAAAGAVACGKDPLSDGSGGDGSASTTSTTGSTSSSTSTVTTGAGPCVLDQSVIDNCTLQ
jgi:hypothetical protein